MDPQGYSIATWFDKVKQEEEDKHAMLDDLSEHEATMKKVLQNKEENIAQKQDTLLLSDIVESTLHAEMKEMEDHEREEAIKRDAHMHEERMERAAMRRQERAAKKTSDAEIIQRNLAVHRQLNPLRPGAAVPE